MSYGENYYNDMYEHAKWMETNIFKEESETWIPGTEKVDKDKHPNDYYDVGGISTHDYIKAKLTKNELRGAYLFLIIKYASRYGKKCGTKYADEARKLAEYSKWLLELEQED